MDENNLVIRNTKGEETNDSRFITTKGGIKELIRVADKIYKTDEYDHLITPETKTGQKIKIPVLDDQGNTVRYDIVDDTIENRRRRNNLIIYKSAASKNSSGYVAHAPGTSFGGSPAEIKGTLDKFDTGAHDVSKWIPSGYSARSVYDDDGEVVLRKLDRYLERVKEKKNVFTKLSYAKQALKHLEDEKDIFPDETEYQKMHDNLMGKVTELSEEYKECLIQLRKAKDKVILIADDVTANYNKRLKAELLELENLVNTIYNKRKKQQKIRGLSLLGSKELSTKINDLNTLRDNTAKLVEEQKIQKQRLLQELQELQEKLNSSEVSIEEGMKKLSEIAAQIESVSDEAIKEKFKQIDDLEAEIVEMEKKLGVKYPSRIVPKKPTKEIEPSLVNLLSFDDDSTEEGTTD